MRLTVHGRQSMIPMMGLKAAGDHLQGGFLASDINDRLSRLRVNLTYVDASEHGRCSTGDGLFSHLIHNQTDCFHMALEESDCASLPGTVGPVFMVMDNTLFSLRRLAPTSADQGSQAASRIDQLIASTSAGVMATLVAAVLLIFALMRVSAAVSRSKPPLQCKPRWLSFLFSTFADLFTLFALWMRQAPLQPSEDSECKPQLPWWTVVAVKRATRGQRLGKKRARKQGSDCRRKLLTCYSGLAFFASQFVTLLYASSLLLRPSIQVIDSLADLAYSGSNYTAAFPAAFTLWRSFERAPPDDLRRVVWQKTIARWTLQQRQQFLVSLDYVDFEAIDRNQQVWISLLSINRFLVRHFCTTHSAPDTEGPQDWQTARYWPFVSRQRLLPQRFLFMMRRGIDARLEQRLRLYSSAYLENGGADYYMTGPHAMSRRAPHERPCLRAVADRSFLHTSSAPLLPPLQQEDIPLLALVIACGVAISAALATLAVEGLLSATTSRRRSRRRRRVSSSQASRRL